MEDNNKGHSNNICNVIQLLVAICIVIFDFQSEIKYMLRVLFFKLISYNQQAFFLYIICSLCTTHFAYDTIVNTKFIVVDSNLQP